MRLRLRYSLHLLRMRQTTLKKFAHAALRGTGPINSVLPASYTVKMSCDCLIFPPANLVDSTIHVISYSCHIIISTHTSIRAVT